MLEKKSKDLNSDDETEYLKDGEEIKGVVKEPKKKERSQKQIDAFEKAKQKRRENLEIKRLQKLKSLKDDTHSKNHYVNAIEEEQEEDCLLYTSPSPRDGLLSRMPSSA